MASRILLVDDLAMFRELGAIFLTRSGPVDLACCAAEALEIARVRKPSILIADMHLPDLSGPELCHRFKTAPEFGNPRILLLARPDSREDHAEAVRAGADEVLFKPLERDTLIASVRRLTDFSTPRGLPRAVLEERVEITARGARVQGMVMNISRGGVLVDIPARFDPSEEVALSFSLGGTGVVMSPTAQVVWSDAGQGQSDLIGLRFLEIDAQTVSKLDYYVSDHYPRTQSLPV